MNKVLTAVVAVLFVGVNIAIYYSTTNKSDAQDLSSELASIEANSKQNQSSENGGYQGGENLGNPEDELVEIVITSQDVREADRLDSIGGTTPYNSSYITDAEIIESIIRITNRPDVMGILDAEYATYLKKLRHVEMLEGITEGNSKVKGLVDEYITKINGANQPQQGGGQVEDDDTETTDEDDFWNDPYSVLNDLMKDSETGEEEGEE